MLNKKYIVICVFLVPFVFFTIDAFAVTGYILPRGSTKLIMLKDGIDLSRKNLSYICINREDEHGASMNGTLKNINFSGSNMCWSNLSHTNFLNCSFHSASLGYVIADDSSFEGCDFTNAVIGNTNIVLSKEQLISTNSFRHKELKGCTFDADFSGVDFSGFDLSGSHFSTHAKFDGCDFSDAKISATALYHEMPPKTHIGNRLTREQLMSTKDFRRRCIINVHLNGFDFSGMDLSGMNFTGCTFSGANFHNADLTDAVFSDCNLPWELCFLNLTLDQIKSTWNYKTGNMEGMALPKEIQEQLDAEKRSEESMESTESTVEPHGILVISILGAGLLGGGYVCYRFITRIGRKKGIDRPKPFMSSKMVPL